MTHEKMMITGSIIGLLLKEREFLKTNLLSIVSERKGGEEKEGKLSRKL
jgi:hypothetical protein